MSRPSDQPLVRERSRGGFSKALLLLFGVVAAGGAVWWLQRPDELELGRRALEKGDVAEARRLWESQLTAHPDDESLRMELAGLYSVDEPRTAVRHYEQIVPESTHYLSAVRHVAFLSIQLNDVPRAEAALRELLRLDSREAAVRLALAELYFRNGRYGAALPEARAAAELQPDRAQTHLLIAEILDELDRVSEMVGPLQTARELDPDSYAVHSNLAYALHFDGELDAARHEAEWCLSRRPDDVAVRRILAAILRDQGQNDAALDQVRTALADAPDDLKCRLLEADLLLYDGREVAAWERLLPLYEQYRNNREFLAGLVRAAFASGHRDEAQQYQHELLSLIPERGIDDDPARVDPR